MVAGEFESMSALHNTLPELVPAPIAWGTYASDPNIHFFICAFHDMTDEIPEVHTFPEKVAKLHKSAISPNGKYGFAVPFYKGLRFQAVPFTDTWEEYYVNTMKHVLGMELDVQGPDEELAQLTEALYEKVIPRLLRPLETGGRRIQPRLCHGDLWDGNCSTDTSNDNPLIFDALAVYAHNECKSE
jgi:protein-ribulosamine 3-kinase